MVILLSLGVSAFPTVNILNTGDIEESTDKIIKMKSNNPYGVFLIKGKYYIKPVEVIFKDGTAGGEAFYTIDITTKQGNPEFIVSGIRKISINTYKELEKVKEVFQYGKSSKSEKTINIEFGEKKYTLSRVYKEYIVKYDEGKNIYKEKMYVYIIKTFFGNKAMEQEFQYSFDLEYDIKMDPIVWIGDLDSDKKLDIVLNYNGLAWGEKGLFLSLYATKGEIVHEVDSSTNWSTN